MDRIKLRKEIRSIVRDRYTTGGGFGENTKYSGLCFTYEDITEIEADILALILQLYTGTTISDSE